MAQLGNTFDATSVDLNTTYEALPPGDYVVQIVESSMEPTSSGNGRYLKLKLEVTDGEQKGKVVFDRLNLENPKELEMFLENKSVEIPVPFSDKTVIYNPTRYIGVGVSRLGTSGAVSVGAYAYALAELERSSV